MSRSDYTDHPSRRVAAARDRKRLIANKKHAKEMARQGWSWWSIAALGADQELVPAIGRAILDHRHRDDFGHHATLVAGLALVNTHRETDAYDHPGADWYDISDWARTVCHREQLAFEWLGRHPELARTLRTGKPHERHNPVRCLGLAMVDWAQVPEQVHGAPSGYNGTPTPNDWVGDSQETDFERWRIDIFRHGLALVAVDGDQEFAAACSWIGRWMHSLWD